MLEGKIIIAGKEYDCVIPETLEERRNGMDSVELGDKYMVYVFCCPTYSLFRGASRGNDLVFLSYDVDKDIFVFKRSAFNISASDIVSEDGIVAIIESEVGNLKPVLDSGGVEDIIVGGMSFKEKLMFKERFRNKSMKVVANQISDYDVARELWFSGFRGEDLRAALKSLGIRDDSIDRILEKLQKEVGNEFKGII